MYELYSKKGMLPSEFMKLSKGEKVVLKAFVLYELENKKDGFCPLVGGERNG